MTDIFSELTIRMSDLDSLVQRFLEDRGSLSSRELDELIAGLRADPEFAITLREQLVLDDLLAQKFALDRRNFVAQVEQRIADFERGHDELSQQVADLRSMAAAEKTRPGASSSGWRWTRYILALAALLVVGVGVYATRTLTTHQPSIAKVTDVVGPVKIEQGDDSDAAEVDDALEGGQRILVPQGGSITFTYQDGTELRVKGDSAVTFAEEQPTAAKQIRIERGEVVANIKPQAAGPMQFTTPHAVAEAPQSLLRLVVDVESTLLDVSEGKVQFHRLTDKRMLLVVANESGMASRDTLQTRQLTWPDRRDGLAYLFSPLESAQSENKPLTVVRNPATRTFRPTPLEPRGDATLLESRWYYELNGGHLFSADAGPDIFYASHGGSELTLEAIFSPASLDQAGPARIVALADESDEPDFALAQDGSDVTFSLRTDATKPSTPPSRLTINMADTPLHLTVTYRNGELIAYSNGMEIARSKDLWGSLAAWRSGPLTVGANASGEHPWRGIMEAFALYNRCLEPGEVARNARNYRLLAGRGM
jgi:ferric-dicitrate binding protein FerR (iron transport regulator)